MIDVEYTDTFGGEANYSWVRRYGITGEGKTDRQIIREAKRLVGLTGVPCRKADMGGSGFALYPRGHNTVLFIMW